MSCAACWQRVERAVSSLDGVESCAVNLLKGTLTVVGKVDIQSVVLALENAGYGAFAEDDTGDARAKYNVSGTDKDTPVLTKRLISSLVLLVFLMYFSMGHMWGLPMPASLASYPQIIGTAQALISGAVLIINRRFFVSGFKGVIHRAPNMDTLVALGSFVSYVYSLYLLLRMWLSDSPETLKELLHGLYFESAAMILAFITIGKMLESRAKGKTANALYSLMNLAPKTARLLKDGEETTVPVGDICEGDVFVVRAGESIPVDGVVLEGEGAIDESMLTGESIPKDKPVGSDVFCATVLASGFVVCRATRVGADTVLSGIIRTVEEAQESKAPVAKLADRVSAVFVPSICLISLVTLVVWLLLDKGLGYSLGRAISVLVISCPCALGLATPVAIMVGSGVGAKRGILFKTASAIEAAGKVKTVIFDKTGTITKGKPEVSEVIDYSSGELLPLAYSLEYMSEHPLAKAVVEYSERIGVQKYPVAEFTAIGGRGVRCTVDGDTAFGVSYEYARTLLDFPAEAENAFLRLTEEGKTPLFFIKASSLVGIIAVSDSLKDDAGRAVLLLKNMGLGVVMLTGDNSRTANAVADKVGITEVISDVLPEEKARAVSELERNERVLMVGDGINDAPALESAHLGIAIGAGADIAKESAGAVIIGSELSLVADAVSLGRATLRVIKENLFFAFIYNAIGIPLAAGVFGLALSPMFGAIAMSLSSLSVVSNALRLNLWKPTGGRKPEEIPVGKETDVAGRNPIEIRNDKETDEREEKKMVIEIKVVGMMCPHCEARVKKALESIDGVLSCVASHTEDKATVTLERDVDRELLVSAVVDAGYEAEL